MEQPIAALRLENDAVATAFAGQFDRMLGRPGLSLDLLCHRYLCRFLGNVPGYTQLIGFDRLVVQELLDLGKLLREPLSISIQRRVVTMLNAQPIFRRYQGRRQSGYRAQLGEFLRVLFEENRLLSAPAECEVHPHQFMESSDPKRIAGDGQKLRKAHRIGPLAGYLETAHVLQEPILVFLHQRSPRWTAVSWAKGFPDKSGINQPMIFQAFCAKQGTNESGRAYPRPLSTFQW